MDRWIRKTIEKKTQPAEMWNREILSAKPWFPSTTKEVIRTTLLRRIAARPPTQAFRARPLFARFPSRSVTDPKIGHNCFFSFFCPIFLGLRRASGFCFPREWLLYGREPSVFRAEPGKRRPTTLREIGVTSDARQRLAETSLSGVIKVFWKHQKAIYIDKTRSTTHVLRAQIPIENEWHVAG